MTTSTRFAASWSAMLFCLALLLRPFTVTPIPHRLHPGDRNTYPPNYVVQRRGLGPWPGALVGHRYWPRPRLMGSKPAVARGGRWLNTRPYSTMSAHTAHGTAQP